MASGYSTGLIAGEAYRMCFLCLSDGRLGGIRTHFRDSGVCRRICQAALVPVIACQRRAARRAVLALILRGKFTQIVSRKLELRLASLAATFCVRQARTRLYAGILMRSDRCRQLRRRAHNRCLLGCAKLAAKGIARECQERYPSCHIGEQIYWEVQVAPRQIWNAVTSTFVGVTNRYACLGTRLSDLHHIVL